MAFLTAKPPIPTKRGGPVWELARNYPPQGYWTEEDYLQLDIARNQLIEYTDGCVEVLPMPTQEHQNIVLFLVMALNAFAKPQKLGKALMAPLPLKLRRAMYREPDVVFMLQEHRSAGDYPERADVVMEVVSAGRADHERDYKQKRREYSRARIPEYWIVDPKKNEILVLKLEGSHYIEHGVFRKGAKATSALLKGFSVEASAVFEAE